MHGELAQNLAHEETLEAGVGIGRLKRRFRGKSTHSCWLHKLTLSLQEPALSLHRF